MIKYHLIEAYRDARRPPAHAPARRAARPRVPRRHPVPVALLPARAARPGRAHRHRRGDHRSDQHAAADHPGPAARRVHQAGQGTQARLHGRLGAPEAQRPGAAHRALQGPVQVARRARRAAIASLVAPPSMPSFRTGDVVTLLESAAGLAARRGRPRRRPERAYVLTQLTGRGRARRPRGREHHRGRARARHRRLARRALEPRARRSGREPRRPGTSSRCATRACRPTSAAPRSTTRSWPTSTRSTGMPVVAAALHSQLAAVAVAFKHARARRRGSRT